MSHKTVTPGDLIEVQGLKWNWIGPLVQELDLELDILRYTGGRVVVRDQDDFATLAADPSVPRDVIASAEAACAAVLDMLERDVEPFRSVGLSWLAQWQVESN